MKLELYGMYLSNGAPVRSVDVAIVPGLTVPDSGGGTLQVVTGVDGDAVVVGWLYADGETRYLGCLAPDGATFVGEWPNEEGAGTYDSDVIRAAARHVCS